MTFRICAIFLAFYVGTLSAQAKNLPTIMTWKFEPVTENGVVEQAEVLVATTEDEGEAEQFQGYFSNELNEAIKKNPNLEKNVAYGDFDETRGPSEVGKNKEIAEKIAGGQTPVKEVVFPEQVRKPFKERFGTFLRKRMTLVCVRFLANSTVSSFSMLVSGIPVEVAVPVGIITGMMSGSLQYFNAQFQKFITSSSFLSTVYKISPKTFDSLRAAIKLPPSTDSLSPSQKKSLQIKALLLKLANGGKSAINFTESVVRSYLSEVAFVGIIKMSVLTGMYFVTHHFGWAPEITGEVFLNALSGYAAQFGFEMMIATKTQKAKKEALAAGNVELANEIQAYGNLKSATLSMIETGGVCMALMKVPFAEQGLLIMGATGWASYAFVSLMEQVKGFRDWFLTFPQRCANFLRPKSIENH